MFLSDIIPVVPLTNVIFIENMVFFSSAGSSMSTISLVAFIRPGLRNRTSANSMRLTLTTIRKNRLGNAAIFYRDKTQIVNDILAAIDAFPDGIGKTRLLYLAQLSSQQLRKYLIILKANDLITTRRATVSDLELHPNIQEYICTTMKARIFLKLFVEEI